MLLFTSELISLGPHHSAALCCLGITSFKAGYPYLIKMCEAVCWEVVETTAPVLVRY